MKNYYVEYYTKYDALAPLKMWISSIFTKNKIKKISLLNRQKDYIALVGQRKLFGLHGVITKSMIDGVEKITSYDYGEGYFYQSFKKIGITGLRNTEDRIQNMDLISHIANKNVLEIGCDSGFSSCLIAPYTNRYCIIAERRD